MLWHLQNFSSKKLLNLKYNHLHIIILVCLLILGVNIYFVYQKYQLAAFDPNNIIALALLNLIIVLLLGVFIINSFYTGTFSLIRKRSKHTNSHLRKRVILAFGLGAAIPAITIAIFSTYFFNLGIQVWFDQKITNVLDQSTTVGDAYIEEHVIQLKETAISIAEDLNVMYYDIIHDRDKFSRVLNAQAEMRSLDEAIVFQRNTNSILAQTSLSFSLSFATIPVHLIERTNNGEVMRIASDPTKIRILIKLENYQDTYLLIGRLIDIKIIDHIDKTSGAAAQYFKLKNKIATMQIMFSLVFILIALILLLSALIFGRIFAERLVQPIRNLVIATEKAKNGDLKVRVPENNQIKDEISTLSAAFNRMISQIDRQQQELIVAQRALAWSDVARQVAHEIKNPLTPIQLSSDRLLKKFKDEVVDSQAFEKYVNNIIKHSNDIKDIVSEFVNFARLPVANFTSYEIVSMINDLVQARKLINNHIEYTFNCNLKKFNFICDVTQINQVMSNLLLNAEDSVTNVTNPKIDIAMLINKNKLSLIVCDNGLGFDQKILNDATSAYVSTKKHGTGLGLAIVSRIVQEHLGVLEISNNAKVGATVKLTFDIQKLKDKLK